MRGSEKAAEGLREVALTGAVSKHPVVDGGVGGVVLGYEGERHVAGRSAISASVAGRDARFHGFSRVCSAGVGDVPAALFSSFDHHELNSPSLINAQTLARGWKARDHRQSVGHSVGDSRTLTALMTVDSTT